jgi:hypothetical protein
MTMTMILRTERIVWMRNMIVTMTTAIMEVIDTINVLSARIQVMGAQNPLRTVRTLPLNREQQQLLYLPMSLLHHDHRCPIPHRRFDNIHQTNP